MSPYIHLGLISLHPLSYMLILNSYHIKQGYKNLKMFTCPPDKYT